MHRTTAAVLTDTQSWVSAGAQTSWYAYDQTGNRLSHSYRGIDGRTYEHDTGAATFGERVAGSGTGDIEDLVDTGLRKEFLSSLFTRYLTPREQRILALYYGLEEGSEALTLEGIGAMLGVTRERVRQIRERAFEKLRNAPEVKHLRNFPMEAA